MFFLCFLGHPGRSMGWAHMQSVRAGAVETHFFVFAFVSKNSVQKIVFLLHFGNIFSTKITILLEKRIPKIASKKGTPPNSNDTLLAGREAPGEAASRARFLYKKRLFGQLFQHFSKLLKNSQQIMADTQQKQGLGR